MTNKKEKLKELSDKLRNSWDEYYECERGIGHHIIHSPHYKEPIHVVIYNHPDQLLDL